MELYQKKFTMSNIRGTVLAIDETHIPIKAFPTNRSRYIKEKVIAGQII